MTICSSGSCHRSGERSTTSPLAADLDRFLTAAAELGFTERVRFATGSQVPVRLLIQAGRPLSGLTVADLAEFTAACRERQRADRQGPSPLPVRDQQHPTGAVPPRRARPAAPIGWTGPVRRAAGRRFAADPGDDDRLSGTETSDLPAQDGVIDRDPTHPLRRLPRRHRPRTGLGGRARPVPTHRAVSDLLGRRGRLQDR